MKITGQIKAINEKSYVSKKTNEESKFLEVLVEQVGEQYPESVLATVFGDKIDNFEKYNNVGDFGELQFNLRARESNGRYFNQISVFRFDKVEKPQAEQQVEEEEDGNLPF